MKKGSRKKKTKRITIHTNKKRGTRPNLVLFLFYFYFFCEEP